MAKTIYRIYPGIGIARIGNSDKFYIGPESPTMPLEHVPTVDGKKQFKADGKILKQAARFRIYEIEIDNNGVERANREITVSDSVKIEWHVTLCNRKAASVEVPRKTNRLRNKGYDRHRLILKSQVSISSEDKAEKKATDEISFLNTSKEKTEGKATVLLGKLKTDKKGRLLVLGGDGVAASPLQEPKPLDDSYNNNGWYDDCCDGPVKARMFEDGQERTVESAWVVVAPPNYAPEINSSVTWYDQAKNAEYLKLKKLDDQISKQKVEGMQTPYFTQDIFPILDSVMRLRWVSPSAYYGHLGKKANYSDPGLLTSLSELIDPPPQGKTTLTPDEAKREDKRKDNRKKREHVFAWLVEPNTKADKASDCMPSDRDNTKRMPMFYSGLNPHDKNVEDGSALTEFVHTSLTDLQYKQISEWSKGIFIADWISAPKAKPFKEMPLEEQPHALDRAALETCNGAPFYPGIEACYRIARPDTYSAPFRINPNHREGYLTELMAVPWHADFATCGRLWWPANRPVHVRIKNDDGAYSLKPFARDFETRVPKKFKSMVQNWCQLGFVVKDGDGYTEQERGTIAKVREKN